MPLDPVLHWILRVSLAWLFVGALRHKLADLRGFSARVRDYRLLPAWASAPVASGLVAAEGAALVSLAVPTFDPAGSAWVLGLLGLYSAAIGANLARGRRHIDCGCLGPGRRGALSAGLLARNAGLAVAALLAWPQPEPRALGWLDAASLLGGLALVGLLWSAAQQLRVPAPAPGSPA